MQPAGAAAMHTNGGNPNLSHTRGEQPLAGFAIRSVVLAFVSNMRVHETVLACGTYPMDTFVHYAGLLIRGHLPYDSAFGCAVMVVGQHSLPVHLPLLCRPCLRTPL